MTEEKGTLDDCCEITKKTNLTELIKDIKMIFNLTDQIRRRRFATGSVSFNRTQLRFRLDPITKAVVGLAPEV